MTDRDTFAAAALSGILTKDDAAQLEKMAPWWPEWACSAAYRWADAMLRERERHHIPDAGKMVENTTTHDAAPEACVQQSTREPERSLLAQSESVERGLPRTGNTQEPVAWMVQNDDGKRWLCHNHPAAAKYGLRCVPLFAKPQPTLTDEEREAIGRVGDFLRGLGELGVKDATKTSLDVHAATLRSLLTRLAVK
jgi:hypothetical protein